MTNRGKALLAGVAGIGLGGFLIASVLAVSPRQPQRLWLESEGRELIDLKPCLTTRTDEFTKTERDARAASAKPTTAEQWAYVAHFVAVVCMTEHDDAVAHVPGIDDPKRRQQVEERLTSDAAALLLRTDLGK